MNNETINVDLDCNVGDTLQQIIYVKNLDLSVFNSIKMHVYKNEYAYDIIINNTQLVISINNDNNSIDILIDKDITKDIVSNIYKYEIEVNQSEKRFTIIKGKIIFRKKYE